MNSIYSLPLIQKLTFLLKIYLIRWRLLKPVYTYTSVPINERTKELLDKSRWEKYASPYNKNDYRSYKKLTDPTGEYRFYIPDISEKEVFRFNEDYAFHDKIKMNPLLLLILSKEGLRNEEIYQKVSTGRDLESIEGRLQ